VVVDGFAGQPVRVAVGDRGQLQAPAEQLVVDGEVKSARPVADFSQPDATRRQTVADDVVDVLTGGRRRTRRW
jgi:hypothetical protein